MAPTPEEKPSGEVWPPFPIVGIGASAGGLEACLQLLAHLPDAPLAVVVVQHLDPKHESKLGELLAKVTPMRVVTATQGEPVRAGCVYVIPPNAGLLIEKGALRLTQRLEGGGKHMPIDLFFRSLAVDCGARAIGVVLSGTGSDGTLGLGAIQREGGITFAQDATAKYDAMPRSAIAAGCVDLVLPPDEIGRKLAHLAGPGNVAIATDVASRDEEENLVAVIAALRKGTAIDFSQYRRTTVRRRVQRRMVVQHIDDLRAYADLLAHSPSEAVALAEDILIHVTSFFRDAEAFEALKTEVFPRLLANRPQGMPIRIWVPGCSSGEEVYSIAIALAEFLGDSKADVPVKLFGTDISEIALEKARAGRYVENIALDVSQERLRRYFVATDGGYRIQRGVRDLCVFAKQDVTRDPPFSNMDLVSCRNLLIYLGPALQSRVLPVFHYALHERGFLLLGASESVTAYPGFTVVDAKNKIFARSPVQLHPVLDFTDPRRVYGASLATRPGPHVTTQIEIQQAADRAVISEYAPRGVIVTDDLVIVQFRGETGAYLQPPPGAATFDLLRMVREELRVELRQALDEARKTRKPAHRRVGGPGKPVEIGVVPFTAAELQRPLYAIVFDEPSSNGAGAVSSPHEASDVEQALRSELAQTRNYLQSVIEQLEAGNEELKAANEEIVSSNEELQSTNEELQTAKEELQAANEELATVNQEMMVRNREATRLSDDLANVLTSASIPIVILSRDGKIRRFTPAAGKLLHLIGADVGRPLGDIKPALDGADLMALVAEVIDQLVPVERSVKDANGRFYSVVARPYMTLDNRIDGAVIVFLDVDALKKGEQAIAAARDFSESIVDTVREGLVVLDEDLRVRSANRPFYHHFALSPDDVVRRPLPELGNGQWNHPALLRELESVRLGGALDGFRLEQDFAKIGRRVLLLNARRFEGVGAPAAWLLLAIEDVTDSARSEEALRDMLTSAAEAILMSDTTGKIVFANAAAHRAYGYPQGELLGLPAENLVPERLRSVREEARAAVGALEARPIGDGALETAGLRKDGSEFAIEIALTPMKGANGPVVVAFVSDVSARKAGEQKLLEYQEKLRHMAFDAALAEERERRRIAINLHDGVGQALALAQNKLAAARTAVEGPVRGAIEECVHLIDESIVQTRSLTFDLSPPILYDLGLEPALQWLAEEMGERYGMRVEVEGDKDLNVAPEAAAMAFRSVRELLTNVFKHAGTSAAKVTLRQEGDRVGIMVEDSGAGFDAREGAGASTGFGLFSIREQIERLGGSVDVVSAPQYGTRVSMFVPASRPASEPPSKGDRP